MKLLKNVFESGMLKLFLPIFSKYGELEEEGVFDDV
jgi:hypothetical protein